MEKNTVVNEKKIERLVVRLCNTSIAHARHGRASRISYGRRSAIGRAGTRAALLMVKEIKGVPTWIANTLIATAVPAYVWTVRS